MSLAQGRRVVNAALALDQGVLAYYLRHLGRDDLAGRQGQLRLPVGVFSPSAPSPGSPQVEAWKRQGGFEAVPDLRQERFPSGHWIMWDDPLGFTARLRDLDAALGRPGDARA